MGINIARSNTEEMVLKEITVALTAYNMVRKIIAKSVNKTNILPTAISFKNAMRSNRNYLLTKRVEYTEDGLHADMEKLLRQIKKQAIKSRPGRNFWLLILSKGAAFP